MTLEAVIFDVDGTLAETEELHRQAFNEAFERHGRDWRWDRAAYHDLLAVEGGLARIRAHVEAVAPRELANLEHAGALEAIHATKSAIYPSLVEQGVPLRPGVARLLRDVRSSGLKLAACTTSTRETFEALILGALGFDALDWFSAVVAREDVDAVKPDPAPYLATLDRLGVAAGAAMVIEDSGRGLAAARAAGVETLAVPGLYTRDDDLSGAALAVSDLGEPAAPFEVLAGDPGPFGYVSTDALRVWHARVCGGEGAAA